MYIINRFILAYFLRLHVAFLTTIIVIMICFLFFDDYISNLLTFFKQISVRNARWYYDYHLFFKFFSSFFLIMIKQYCCFSTFESVLLTIRLCITENLIVSDIILYSAVREHVFYTIMNYESYLIDFLYNQQLSWCKQILNERFAAAARLIIYI